MKSKYRLNKLGALSVSALTTLFFMSSSVVALADQNGNEVGNNVDGTNQNSSYSFSSKNIVLNGKTISTVEGFVSSGTSYLPIWYVMQAMNQLGYTDTWDGKTWNISLPVSFSGLVQSVDYGTGKQEIVLANRARAHVDGITTIDPQSGQLTTFMPIWYVMQLVKAAGVSVQWDGFTWTMKTSVGTTVVSAPPNSGTTQPSTPSGNASSTPPSSPVMSHTSPYVFLMYMSGSAASISDVNQSFPNVNEIAPGGLYLNRDGSIGGSLSSGSLDYAHSKSINALPRLSSSDSSVISAVLSNASLRTTLINNIVSEVNQYNLAGINLDFEIVPTDQRNNFTAFLHDLYSQLHPMHKELSVALPAVTDPANEYWDDGYDFHAIGQNVDYAVIMAYDYSYPGGAPGPIAPVWWVNKAATYAVSQMPSSKVLLGIDVYGYDWGDSYATAWDLPSLDNQVQSNNISVQWDASDEAPFYMYSQNGVTHTVYYENAQSTSAKLLVAEQLHLAGIAVWRAGLEDAAIASVLGKYTG